MEVFYHKHYISVDSCGRIADGFSDAFRNPSDTDICINERGSYQFRLFPDGEENPGLLETHGVPLYRYDGGAVIKRRQEEIERDLSLLPEPEPTAEEMRDAQIFYTAMMTDTLLEEV